MKSEKVDANRTHKKEQRDASCRKHVMLKNKRQNGKDTFVFSIIEKEQKNTNKIYEQQQQNPYRYLYFHHFFYQNANYANSAGTICLNKSAC